jgi:predicted MFS family arabinose efflux permease
MFLLGIALLFVAVAILGFTRNALVFYGALWLFFVGFNYLEATLPSLVSKVVFAGGKGTAMGVYSTCQFLGAFAGGAAGGWVLQYAGLGALIGLCLALAGLWLLLFLPARSIPVPAGQ